MSRELTPRSTLEHLKREAKRWLAALRAGDVAARARFEQHHPHPPPQPALRDVQLALARAHGRAGWSELKRDVLALERARATQTREESIAQLFEACINADATLVASILDDDPELINAREAIPGHDGARTALHHAIAHEQVVRLLLERGADPNIRDEGDDAMPLHFAAERGDLNVVRLLVEHGADTIGAGTYHELNVLGWAVCWDYVHNEEVARYLLAHGAQHTIHTAVALGDVAALRRLAAASPASLEQPMDRTNHGRRPLHLAVIKNQVAALQALLELGADTEAVDAAGLTPLDQAAVSGADEMVQLLLAHGARVSLPAAFALQRHDDVQRLLRAEPDALKAGGRWSTLIVRAAEGGATDVMLALLRAGADVNARDDTETAIDQTGDYTALHAAAWNGRLDVIRLLLEHGADPNIRESKYCAAPAGWADYAGHTEARDLILEAPIDLFQAIDFDRTDRIPERVQHNPRLLEQRFHEYAACAASDDAWRTPLAYAVARNHADAVRTLLELGASPVRSPQGETLVQLARAAGQDDIVTLL